MMKQLLFFFLALVFYSGSYGQSPLWSVANVDRVASLPKAERTTQPREFKLYSLNFAAMKNQLALAPARETGQTSNVIVAFPAADGTMHNYRIHEASVMHPELAAKYPNTKSYVGQAVDNPSETVRFSITMFGLHAMRFSTNGIDYIDTYTQDLQNYIVYSRSSLQKERQFDCHVVAEESDLGGRNAQESQASDGIFRRYRLAMASTVEYSAFHINAAGMNAGTLAQKKAAVLDAMNVTMTRVNGIYERDMSLTMQLVPNNDLIIFVTSDSFNNDDAEILIDQSQSVIDATIGFSNYDIGHTVSTGGGGLAQLQSPCTSSKARGITGSPSPVGDPFDIDYVAHEMGHQFGGTHTFNNSCGGNVEASTAVEPGSGTTIMAYAGICAPDIQSNSSPHFHAVSIAQMQAFVQSTGTCSVNVPNGNAAPVVNAGPNYTIPKGTAFVLRGSATDANNDTLTYSWEQTNFTSSVQPPQSTSTGGPNFLSQNPSTSPNRYMPNFASVLEGNLAPTWEVVPTVARTLNFALTVRDNRTPNGGQTGRDDTIITVANVGPFKVTNPDVENVSWTQNTSQTVTWDVAGTTANGINTATVNILYSSDAGATFTMLVANTPNDGSEPITVPNIAAPYNRIMIEAVGNVFYAVSKSFAVGYTVQEITTCNTYPGTISNANIAGVNPPQYYALGSVVVPASDAGPISDLNMSVNITHANINNLYIGLVKPGSTQVDRVVYQQSCVQFAGTSINTTFDDEGLAFSCGGIGAGNSYVPLNSLAIFDGVEAQGQWRIAIADLTVAQSGTLNSWGLTICRTTTTVTLASENFGFTDFAVYPNPNNGQFSIRFSDATSDDVNVVVHDIRGRMIYEKAYAGNGMFTQDIQLNNAEAGIYLLTVTNGERKEVKRIVVE
ncbi:MAG TPA: zinc-dependent metalloprotease family protein [Flavobacterium sp.]